jgi:organic hydroperoxide reductase OsmC/OhrA
VLVIRRIVVRYRLPVPEDRRADAERAHAVHQRGCPVARSIGGSIDIRTELEMV